MRHVSFIRQLESAPFITVPIHLIAEEDLREGIPRYTLIAKPEIYAPQVVRVAIERSKPIYFLREDAKPREKGSPFYDGSQIEHIVNTTGASAQFRDL